MEDTTVLSLPNVVIAGVTRAGTTSLFTYLSAHPEVCGSNIKEIDHFLPLRFGGQCPPLEAYSEHFPTWKGEKYRLEASPSYYIGGRKLARTLRDSLPDAKIALVFRDPVKRCVSFYRYQKNMVNLPRDMSFQDYVSKCEQLASANFRDRTNIKFYGLHSGIYAEFIEDWYDVIGPDLRICFFEFLTRDTAAQMMDLCEWLGVDKTFYDGYEFTVENKSRFYKARALHRLALKTNTRLETVLRRHVRLKRLFRAMYYAVNGRSLSDEVDAETVNRVRSFYTPHNQRFAELLTARGFDGPRPPWLQAEATAG